MMCYTRFRFAEYLPASPSLPSEADELKNVVGALLSVLLVAAPLPSRRRAGVSSDCDVELTDMLEGSSQPND